MCLGEGKENFDLGEVLVRFDLIRVCVGEANESFDLIEVLTIFDLIELMQGVERGWRRMQTYDEQLPLIV